MKYDWEKYVERQMWQFESILPDNLQIVGIAVENVETGEGALVEANSTPAKLHDVVEADIRQDILGDATLQYETVFEAVFRSGEPKERMQ